MAAMPGAPFVSGNHFGERKTIRQVRSWNPRPYFPSKSLLSSSINVPMSLNWR